MVPQCMRALSGALMVVLVSGACQDAPLGPRAPAMNAPPVQRVVRAVAFSGRSADSLIDVLSPQWARLGHPEYRREIDAWRQRELGTAETSTLLDAGDGRRIGPSYLIESGGETAKAPPSIVTHQEALYFGSSSSGVTVPGTLTGEMVFVGDQGKISVSSFSIVSNSGAVYSTSGVLASGSGQLLSCVNIGSASCVDERRLNGVLPLTGAPVCDAHGSGNIDYLAQNVQPASSYNFTTGISPTTGVVVEASSPLTAHLDAIASACPPAKDTTVQPPPTPGAPPDTPPPSFPSPDPEPLPPLAPPPPPADECTSYIDPITLYVEVDCYTY